MAEETLDVLQERRNLNLDGQEVIIPKEVMKEFRKDSLNDSDFDDWLNGHAFEVLDYEGIVDEEIAKFVIAYQTQSKGFGGNPIEEYMTFKENGFEYTICSFGRKGTNEYDFTKLIGYKKKI